MRVINRDIVSAHLYSSDGELLMVRNSNAESGVVYGDCWKIPGGGVEDGESKIEALKREILEEVGIDVGGIDPELINDSITGETEKVLRDTREKVIAKMNFYTYKITLDSLAEDTEIVLDRHEFDEYRWFEISELKEIKLSPPSIELFESLGLI